MQPKEKEFAIILGNLVRKLRRENTKNYSLYLDENLIPSSTLQTLESAKSSPKLYTLMRILGGMGISLADFAKLLEKELPKDIFNRD